MQPEFVTAATAYALNRKFMNVKTPQEFFQQFPIEDYVFGGEPSPQRAVGFSEDEAKEILYQRRRAQYYGERLLWELGRPYYKLWPDYLDAFLRTKLNMTRKHIKMPFPSWEIRLPIGALEFEFQEGQMSSITTLWVLHVRQLQQDVPLQDFVRQLGLDELPTDAWDHVYLVCLSNPEHHRTISSLVLYSDDSTVEDTLQRAINSNKYLSPSRIQTFRAIFSIVLTTVGLITGNDDLIEIDVLAKDAHKLRPGMPAEEKERLQEKAGKRRILDGKGYTIGRRDRLLHVVQQRAAEAETDGEGRPLKYSHFRCGHLHRYNTRDGYVMRWIPMLTVRPDLPPDPRGRTGVQIK